MSQLYIRLMTGFYQHRKTARLRATLGNDALWIPPRLWAYCAENQPDGDISSYSPAELGMLIGYQGDASSMLVALKDCGFVTSEGIINGWDEHNGYHQKYSERAKTAAEARWGKKEKKQKKESTEKEIRKGESGDKHCLTNACSMLVASEVLKKRISGWFKRRESTKWTESEEKKLKTVLELETAPEDVDLLESFYLSDAPYKRHDIVTLLNNWNGEIDRARGWKEGRNEVPKEGTNKVWALTKQLEAIEEQIKKIANKGHENAHGLELPPEYRPEYKRLCSERKRLKEAIAKGGA